MPAVSRALRGAVAVAGLLALLVGVPVLLAIAVGWPLPRGVPVWHDITATFSGELPLDPTTVWKVLACVVWVAWAQILTATIVEAAALARGGVALPIHGLTHMQGLIGPLLGTAALLLPSSVASPAATPAVPSLAAARTLVTLGDSPTSLPTPTPPDTPQAPASAPATTMDHIVVRGDTLWDLAERYLAPGGTHEQIGAGVRDLFEFNKNRPQPDGSSLTDASLIRPGWVLRIPVTSPPATPAGSTVTVAPDDSLWQIAEEHLGDGHRYREVFDLNAGRPQPDGDTLTEPSLIRPGWRLELPANGTEPPAAPASGPAEVTAPTQASAPASPTPSPLPVQGPSQAPSSTNRDTSPDDEATTRIPPTTQTTVSDTPALADSPSDHRAAPIGALGIAGGLLGAGLATTLAFRRRRQRVHRQPGTERPPLPADAAPVVDALADADCDLTIGIDYALRRLGHELASRPSIPVPVIATLDGTNLELLLDRDDPNPPDGWTAVAAGRIWRTPLEPGGDDPTAGPAWLPTLVSIGALDAGGLLLNLEAVGAVGLVGDATACAALARSIAVELTLTPLADLPAVHVVGDVIGDVTGLPHVRRHDDFAAALGAAAKDTAAIVSAITQPDAASVIGLRCRAPDEAWPPAVIVTDSTEGDIDAVTRGSEYAGVVVVIVGRCPAGALEVHVTSNELVVPALGLRCAPQQLDEAVVDTISEMLDIADDACVVPADSEPLVLFPRDDLDTNNESETSDSQKLHLRLLGPITVEGVELQPQQLALLAYLALHGEVTADALREAVWGGKPPTRERFLNTVHEFRRVVGADVLPTSTDGRYRLQHVWTDLAEVERLVASASAHGEEAVTHLRAALELVSGPPISYERRHRRHFTWVDLGNHASRWERIVADAAHLLATIALSDGDVDLARWAAERGLVAAPASETLTCDLISAHLAAGDRVRAERVGDEYARVLDDLGFDEPPEAVQELLEGRRAS
jgi:nucleoid-associated protein YgaU/DNA-binding SARP family transcriptional activator